MSIEHHEELLAVEDHIDFLASELKLADPDQQWIINVIVNDFLWLVDLVRKHNFETINYQEEIEFLTDLVNKR